MVMRLIFVLCVSLGLIGTLTAQNSQESTLGVQFSYWGTFNLDAAIPVRAKAKELPLRLKLSVEDRRLGFPDKQHHFLTTAQFYLPFKVRDSLTISPIIGYTFFLGQNANLSDNTDPQVPENRPYQGLSIRYKKGKLSFSSRILAEQRWIRNANQFERLPGNLFFLRLRFLAELDISLYKPDNSKRELSFFIFDEIMPQFGNMQAQTFDQNRASIGFTYQTRNPLSVSIGYLVWYQVMPNGVQRWLRHISTLSLTYRL